MSNMPSQPMMSEPIFALRGSEDRGTVLLGGNRINRPDHPPA
jgi:hypothetical protein